MKIPKDEEMPNQFPQTLILGANGFVGSKTLELLDKDRAKIYSPTHQELDVNNTEKIRQFLTDNPIRILVNLIAHTNLAGGEKERGNRNGNVWNLNVEVPKNLAQICREKDIFLIHISTDTIFPGTTDFKGPYNESMIPPDNLEDLSWYAYTKLKSEEAVKDAGCNFAIVRISYPFGSINANKDFAMKTISYIQSGYDLFFNQNFTPTYIPDFVEVLKKLAKQKNPGIYHVVCSGITTPYDFGSFIQHKLHLGEPVKAGDIDQWNTRQGIVKRAKFGGLKNDSTQKSLQTKFHTWQEALEEFLPQIH
jgi:dTDP-4-dehydrorhamnose reductase